MHIGPVAAARAEAAWLQGDNERTRDEVADAYALALRHPEPWRLGELGLWLWRAGALDRPLDGMAPPYRLEIGGDWQAAADEWRGIGCPYEEALALAQGDRPAQLRALDILTGLGAAPAAAMVRRHLRAEGARGIPRGPRAATRHNPLGLTARQVGDPGPARRRPEQQGDRRAAAHRAEDGRPSRVRHPGQARGRHPQAGGPAPRHPRAAGQT